MSDKVNSIPLEEDDVLRSLKEQEKRIKMAVAMLREMDPLWPYLPGFADCRYCGQPVGKHKDTCEFKIIVGGE